MFAIVAIPFEAFQDLPPFEFKLMAAVLRYANRLGRAWPTLAQLAGEVLVSPSTVSRGLDRLEERGCFTRERLGNGRYFYQIAERFLPKWPRRKSRDRHVAAVQDRVAHGATQEADPAKHTPLNPPTGGPVEKQEGEGEPAAGIVAPRRRNERPPRDNLLPPDPWPQRLMSWRKSRFWLPDWGARPDESGCLAPKTLLAVTAVTAGRR